jgi:hypothetical protein
MLGPLDAAALERQDSAMTFEDRFSQPRDGHALVPLEREAGVSWCLRCGALWFDQRPDLRAASHWEAPGQAGRSHATATAPPCLPSTSPGAANVVGDANLMLRALTHGWRCDPVLLEVKERTEAWRWSREGLLGGEAWSVVGAWEDGPVVDDTVRRVLLTAGDPSTVSSR